MTTEDRWYEQVTAAFNNAELPETDGNLSLPPRLHLKIALHIYRNYCSVSGWQQHCSGNSLVILFFSLFWMKEWNAYHQVIQCRLCPASFGMSICKMYNEKTWKWHFSLLTLLHYAHNWNLKHTQDCYFSGARLCTSPCGTSWISPSLHPVNVPLGNCFSTGQKKQIRIGSFSKPFLLYF